MTHRNTEDALIEAMFIGKLCRDGVIIHYINLPRGGNKFGDVSELIDYCRRNRWLDRA